jgi:hypothetical protein
VAGIWAGQTMPEFMDRSARKLHLRLFTKRADLKQRVTLVALPSVKEANASRRTPVTSTIHKFGCNQLPAIRLLV